ncbi:unnamed protein product [Rotaria sordida]|uniref:Zinc finger MYM-type protein 1-like n=1 Tax=Rotaria sordida TaxID=392033 RepID=A0A818TJB5_9BILA|nr:unnamed protein product [Rotaria sordida]CAF1318203.1 unnamed protein product [Rotaria sordida]CAF3685519.1 unnamed protein product [Rotaria sordida]CAF3740146.1 unnamed protein product [Rotaria sordida]CAF3903195.1 unnamed protein product [Rotaria sordida]
MMDESADVSRHEQVCLVIRYTDDQFHVYERFIRFERTSCTTGEVDQCYDSASAIRAIYKGIAAHLIQFIPIALYIHCNGHILNLCLIDLSEVVVPIRNNSSIIKSLYHLIEVSAKRHHIFDDIQKQAGLASIPLKQLCDTRWSCRYESLTVVLTHCAEIITVLKEIGVGDVFIMLHVMQTFDFIFHIHLMSEVFLLTNILSKYLQKSDVSLTQALTQVKITIASLKSMRSEHEFNRGSDVALATLSVKDNYRINSFYAVLDVITVSIKERFNENNINVLVLSEQRMYKVALGNKTQLSLTLATKFSLENSFHQSISENIMDNSS